MLAYASYKQAINDRWDAGGWFRVHLSFYTLEPDKIGDYKRYQEINEIVLLTCDILSIYIYIYI